MEEFVVAHIVLRTSARELQIEIEGALCTVVKVVELAVGWRHAHIVEYLLRLYVEASEDKQTRLYNLELLATRRIVCMDGKVYTLLRVHKSRVEDVRSVFVHQSLIHLQLVLLAGDVCRAKLYVLYLLFLQGVIVCPMGYYGVKALVKRLIVGVQTKGLQAKSDCKYQ